MSKVIICQEAQTCSSRVIRADTRHWRSRSAYRPQVRHIVRSAPDTLSPVPIESIKFHENPIQFTGVHHVAVICENLERSIDFYCGLLGLSVNPDRPDSKLPYRGLWLWIGPEMIHLMELPNPDPMEGRPDHGGRDRHFCVGTSNIGPLVERLKEAGIPHTMSKSGRAAVFFRDPDMNTLEVVELESWR